MRGGRTPQGNSSTGGLGEEGEWRVTTVSVCLCFGFIRRCFAEKGMLHIQIITDHPYKLKGSQLTCKSNTHKHTAAEYKL